MPFQLFYSLFPDVAKAETRAVGLPESEGPLPAGWYFFKEMFCNEPGCDCRRVFFMVGSSFRDGIEATIAWGWEDLKFYERWLGKRNKADAPLLIGPIIDPMCPQKELAPHLLDLFKNVLLKDTEYLERVKRHYAMFREKIESPTPPRRKAKERCKTRGHYYD